jgi:hypothetical protein
VNFFSYSVSWGMALFASIIFVGYGIGLLQIAGINGELQIAGINVDSAKLADVIIGSLIIAFISKPTHDVIKIIESIRTVKK